MKVHINTLMTGLWRVAVIFVCKFIYEAYYVCGKQATYYSAKNSNNKFYNRCHASTSFRSEVSM